MPQACGRPCSRTAEQTDTVRKWKRVDTADGPRFRSALAAHEAALLQSLVTSMLGMLEERESSSPADELEEITGMKTGNSQPPQDDTMKRLLPDFYRPQTRPSCRLRHRGEPQQRAAQPARAGDHRRETPSGATVVGHHARTAAASSSSPRTTRTPGRPPSTTCGSRWARCSTSARTGPTGCPPIIRWPATRRVPVADGAAGVSRTWADGQAMSDDARCRRRARQTADERDHRRRRHPRRPTPSTRCRRRRSVRAGPAAPPSC